MAAWTKAQQLPQSTLPQVQSIYGEHFPFEIRQYLANKIGEQTWETIDPDFPPHEHVIKELISSFIREIENKASSINGEDAFLDKVKLTKLASSFREQYESNPVDLFRTLRHCVGSEMKLIQNYENIPNLIDFKPPILPGYRERMEDDEINQEIEFLESFTQKITDHIKQLETCQEGYSLLCYELQRIVERIGELQQSSLECPQNRLMLGKLGQQEREGQAKIQSKPNEMQGYLYHIIRSIEESCQKINNVLNRVLDNQLIWWKRNQQFAGNGGNFELGRLDVLQTWCGKLAQILWRCLTQIKETKRLANNIAKRCGFDINSHLHESYKVMTELLSRLVTSTFLIEKQPPQVMKTNTRFSAKVRLLVGGQLSVFMNPPQVKVSIISEAQANCLLSEKTLKGEVSGDILNNMGTMEYDPQTDQLSVTFRNMQLKKIKRAEKKGSESVVDEKFSLYFCSNFNVGGEFDFNVWTLSLPVTVIVHGNQEPHAWATITWDNAFAEPARKPFVVPDKVEWGKVANALNMKFHFLTDRGLSNENLNYLAEKLFKKHMSDYSTMPITWTQFSKESLSERNFTFWDWFYAIMKLTREHLKSLWTAGHIMGFVRKKEAENLLMNSQPGTFLLRFSDSELGGITIAWNGGVGQQSKVVMVHPFTAKDFAIRTLADRINDLSELKYLYPHIPKEKAFASFYTPYSDSLCNNAGGYVKPSLVIQLPRLAETSSTIAPLFSNPTTPCSMYSHSPEVENFPQGCPLQASAMDYDFPDFSNMSSLVSSHTEEMGTGSY